MKYVKLWEQWQWLHKKDEESERSYRAKLSELLDWAYGSDWREDWHEIESLPLFVDGDEVDDDQLLGWHETFRRAANQEIEIEAVEEEEWGIIVQWELNGVDFELVVQDWPFTDDNVTEEESQLVRRLLSSPETKDIDTPIVVDFVQWALRQQGMQEKEVTPAAFANWLDTRRFGLN